VAAITYGRSIDSYENVAIGTLVLLELGVRWTARWATPAVVRAGVFSYRTAREPIAEESL